MDCPKWKYFFFRKKEKKNKNNFHPIENISNDQTKILFLFVIYPLSLQFFIYVFIYFVIYFEMKNVSK